MANRTVKVDILADEKNFVRGTGAAGTSATKLSQVLSKMGPVGTVLQNVLNNLGLSSITAGAGIAGGVTAALGVSLALVEKAINSYLAITDSIRSYSLVTGQSAEASSRQVTAFKELGVSEDVAQISMFRLGKVADETPKKLEKLGIAVAKDAKGNFDLNATLINIMQAYQGTTDAGQRATIMFTAFGRGGQEMVKILETNVAELTKMEAEVGKVYTQADLDQARKYEISQKQLGQNWSDFGANIGAAVVPALSNLFEHQNALIYANKRLNESFKAGKITYDQSIEQNSALQRGYEKEYLAAQDAKAGTEALANAHQAAANAARAEADAEDKLYNELHKSQSSAFALEQANIDLQKAQATVAGESLKDAAAAQKVDAAQDALTATIKKFGAGSEQAAAATIALQQAQSAAGATGLQAVEDNLRLREAYVKVADAAVTLAEDQATANGTTLTATQKADLYRKSLENLMAQLGPNDPLRTNLQAYIDELNAIPSAKSTSISATFPGHRSSGTQAFAGGGMVGGSSSEHPVLAKRGEGVFTPEQMAALPDTYGGGRAKELHVHVHIQGFISDGPTIDLVANAVALRLGYSTGR